MKPEIEPKTTERKPEVSRNTAPQEQKSPLAEALDLYWPHLIGPALFPSVLFIGAKVLGVFVVVLFLPLFLIFLQTAWPCLRNDAPYSFLGVACAVWMAGGVVGLIVQALISVPGGH